MSKRTPGKQFLQPLFLHSQDLVLERSFMSLPGIVGVAFALD